MIVEALLQAIQFILGNIIKLFPSVADMPVQISSAFSYFHNYFAWANHFVPMGTILAIFSIYVFVEGSILLMAFLNWSYNKIRGAG